jgi:peptide/nickel transport system ATP-binding protein
MTGQPLLSVRDLTVTYPRGRRQAPLTALSHIDLDVEEGQTVSVVGESGSGKSTLGNAILGMVVPTAGTISFAGEQITHATRARRRALTRQIQVVFQDPFGSLNPARTIGQTLEESLLAHQNLTRQQRSGQVAAALERVGLSGADAARYPASFSGGQRQRIAIARALVPEPRLLVCDEAVSALDLSIQAQVLNLLRSLQRELRLALLFITHDMAVVAHISDRVAVLCQGQLMETGSGRDVTERPQHPCTQLLIAAAPVPDPAAQRLRRIASGQIAAPPPSTDPASTDPTSTDPASTDPPPRTGCPFQPRCDYAASVCEQPLPRHSVGTGIVACHRYAELPARPFLGGTSR